jgi:hypothetical protein
MIHVADGESVELARAAAEHVDALLLDSAPDACTIGKSADASATKRLEDRSGRLQRANDPSCKAKTELPSCFGL